MEGRIETILSIDQIRLKAYHGWYAAERKIGGMYSISVKIYDTAPVSETYTEIEDSVNYENVYEIVSKLMRQEFKLIEECCKALWTALKELKNDAKWEVLLVKEDVPIKYVGHTSFCIKG